MRILMIPAIAVTALAGAASLAPAQAVGCLSGAAAGAVAGHYAGHHAVLGAAAGCAIGHHYANRQPAPQDRAYEPGPGYNPNVQGYQRPAPYGQP